MMAPKALGELIASVGRDGLQDPIITFEGKVLDGRNRQLACSNASVKPVYKKYTGDDPLGFVIRANLHRRHLTTSQRTMVAANLANLERGDNQHASEEATSQSDAADLLNVSRSGVQRAQKVIDSGDDELVEAVVSGDTSVTGAANSLVDRPPVDRDAQDLCRLLAAWDQASPVAKRDFLKGIGAD
jgi:hypothetical protein